MSFAGVFSSGRFALLAAAAFLAVGAAHAQISAPASTPADSKAAAVSSSDPSSSSSSFSSSSFFDTSSDAADPSAPEPAGGAAGQYDNKAGGGGHGWKGRLAFEAGGGANAPTSDSKPYITWGGNLTVGGGLHFSRGISLLAEYQFMDDKLPGALIAETGATGGDAHIWSLTIAPVIDLMPKHTNSIYVTGGGGFYRKVTNFTDPEEQEYCTYYYCGVGVSNEVVGHFSSNQGGWNIGAGFSHKMGGIYGDGKAQLFAEGRYLDVLTPAVTTSPNGLGTTTVGAGTKVVPITLGVRF